MIPYTQVNRSMDEWLGFRRVKMSGEGYTSGSNAVPTPGYYDETAKQTQEILDVRGSMHLGSLRTPTTRSILLSRIEQIKNHLKAHEDALASLDKQPDTEKLLDSLRKLGI